MLWYLQFLCVAALWILAFKPYVPIFRHFWAVTIRPFFKMMLPYFIAFFKCTLVLTPMVFFTAFVLTMEFKYNADFKVYMLNNFVIPSQYLQVVLNFFNPALNFIWPAPTADIFFDGNINKLNLFFERFKNIAVFKMEFEPFVFKDCLAYQTIFKEGLAPRHYSGLENKALFATDFAPQLFKDNFLNKVIFDVELVSQFNNIKCDTISMRPIVMATSSMLNEKVTFGDNVVNILKCMQHHSNTAAASLLFINETTKDMLYLNMPNYKINSLLSDLPNFPVSYSKLLEMGFVYAKKWEALDLENTALNQILRFKPPYLAELNNILMDHVLAYKASYGFGLPMGLNPIYVPNTLSKALNLTMPIMYVPFNFNLEWLSNDSFMVGNPFQVLVRNLKAVHMDPAAYALLCKSHFYTFLPYTELINISGLFTLVCPNLLEIYSNNASFISQMEIVTDSDLLLLNSTLEWQSDIVKSVIYSIINAAYYNNDAYHAANPVFGMPQESSDSGFRQLDYGRCWIPRLEAYVTFLETDSLAAKAAKFKEAVSNNFFWFNKEYLPNELRERHLVFLSDLTKKIKMATLNCSNNSEVVHFILSIEHYIKRWNPMSHSSLYGYPQHSLRGHPVCDFDIYQIWQTAYNVTWPKEILNTPALLLFYLPAVGETIAPIDYMGLLNIPPINLNPLLNETQLMDLDPLVNEIQLMDLDPLVNELEAINDFAGELEGYNLGPINNVYREVVSLTI